MSPAHRSLRLTISQRQRAAFTLIELLVVISVIALLIALLLPTMAQAREAANNILCASNQKQIALAAVLYAEDHDGNLPVGIKHQGPDFYWPSTMMPWTQDEDIYICRTRLGGYPDHIAYVANGDAYMFYYEARGQPTNLASIRDTSKVFMVREATEDWALAQRGIAQGFRPLGADIQMKMEYFDNPNPGHKSMGGRHFRDGGSKTTDPWGFDNISFVDGHVKGYPMQQIVEQSAPRTWWFEYPHTPAAAKPFQSAPPPGTAPQPGAEWWGPPYW